MWSAAAKKLKIDYCDIRGFYFLPAMGFESLNKVVLTVDVLGVDPHQFILFRTLILHRSLARV